MSATARDFLRRLAYLDAFEHQMRDADAYAMACRVREDAAYLIGYCA